MTKVTEISRTTPRKIERLQILAPRRGKQYYLKIMNIEEKGGGVEELVKLP